MDEARALEGIWNYELSGDELHFSITVSYFPNLIDEFETVFGVWDCDLTQIKCKFYRWMQNDWPSFMGSESTDDKETVLVTVLKKGGFVWNFIDNELEQLREIEDNFDDEVPSPLGA